MNKISVIEIFKDHKLVKAEKKCDCCHGTLYRIFDNGTVVCVKCKKTVSGQTKPKGKK